MQTMKTIHFCDAVKVTATLPRFSKYSNPLVEQLIQYLSFAKARLPSTTVGIDSDRRVLCSIQKYSLYYYIHKKFCRELNNV